jgi:hypothetical protein
MDDTTVIENEPEVVDNVHDVYLYTTTFNKTYLKTNTSQRTGKVDPREFVIRSNNLAQFKEALWTRALKLIDREACYTLDDGSNRVFSWSEELKPTIESMDKFVVLKEGKNLIVVSSVTTRQLQAWKKKTFGMIVFKYSFILTNRVPLLLTLELIKY